MYRFMQHRAIGIQLGALFLLCSAQTFAASPQAGEEQLEPTVIVDAVRMERGVKSKRYDEHVVTYVFWVKSEAALLNLSCVISDLEISEKRKNASAAVPPMQADLSQGCRLEVPNAIASIGGGQSKLARFEDGKRSVYGGRETDYVTFQTLDNSAFEQNVYVTVAWKQKSPMQLSGVYEGAVRLVAKIPNEIEKPK